MNTKVSSNYKEDEEYISPKFSIKLTMETEEVNLWSSSHICSFEGGLNFEITFLWNESVCLGVDVI